MTIYIRFLVLPFLIILALWASVLGHYWIWVYLFFLNGFIILGDAFLGKDSSTPNYRYPQILTVFLYLNFPLSLLLLTTSAYMTGNETIPIFEKISQVLFNTDITYNRNQTPWWCFIGYVWVVGLLISSGGTLTGHELVHHKKKKWDVIVGNWCLALSWDCAFGIEHVHGHHKNVGTKIDPATAQEGESPFRFFVKASSQEHQDAWDIELTRLKRRGISFFSFQNQMLKGYVRSGLITFWVFFVGGLPGVFLFLFIVVASKLVLEMVNYMEHYGLVRVPGTPVESRHSWNSTKRLSSLLLYNLTRHSHHHEKGSLEFWKLKPYTKAPQMPYGYLTTLYFVLFFPEKYRKIMKQKLDDWFVRFASQDEKKLRPVL
jgi:alkane 1-monooxygenase